MLKTTDFVSGFFMVRQRKSFAIHNQSYSIFLHEQLFLLPEDDFRYQIIRKNGRKMYIFEHRRFCEVKKSHFILDTVYKR
jgi:hypothetical protein